MNSESTWTPGDAYRLDALTLSRKEGWAAFADAEARIQPELLPRSDYLALGERARAEYDQARRLWHANLGPLRTPQLAELHEDLWDIVDSNQQDGDKAKGAIAVDAFPGLGKTTAVLAFARDFLPLSTRRFSRASSSCRHSARPWSVLSSKDRMSRRVVRRPVWARTALS
ncbi:hypothetical protein [Streptomyces sp. NPDC057740]|uniref:hypothetical protein n=1 Tax=Streptomyces sp. NPDC057740 TaxID=3346234 RepID=UPI0036AA0B59